MSRRTRDVSPLVSSYEVVDLRQAIARFLPRAGLGVRACDDKRRWVPRMIVAAALLMTLDSAVAITDRFHAALAAVRAMWPTRRRPGDTYGGFMQALRAESPGLPGIIIPRLRKHVRAVAHRSAQTCWKIGRWIVFGVDGSRIECPMTAANEKAFGTAGKQKTGPQQFLTVMFHVATGLIWDYRRGDARASERGHMLEMLGALPPDALVVADAGFTGYNVFRAIIDGGRSLLIRVGANVRLLMKLEGHAERKGNIVYLWPEEAQKKNLPPLTLRLITIQDGTRKMHLLTNVFDETQLSDEQANAIYRKRWGVELIYRALKQTLGRRRMRCASPGNAAVELDWAVISLWLLGLLSVSQLIDAGHKPGQWSVASSLRIVRRRIRSVGCRSRRRRGPSLSQALATARLDGYQRHGSKKSRHWPHKKTERPPAAPMARTATDAEVELAKRLRVFEPPVR